MLLSRANHSLIFGMLMSSMKSDIFLPAGGPYVLPTRLSMNDSIERWMMFGVVADEKLSDLCVCVSGLKRSRFALIITVFAVPETRREQRIITCTLTVYTETDNRFMFMVPCPVHSMSSQFVRVLVYVYGSERIG